MGRIDGAGINALRLNCWSYDLVEERLLELIELWRRTPGDGRWPFASDAPWHLIRKERSDADALDPKPLPRLPLGRAEVARRDERSDWIIRYVPEADRQLVWRVLMVKVTGNRINWRRMCQQLGLGDAVDAVRMRYRRAIAGMARALDKAGVPAFTHSSE